MPMTASELQKRLSRINRDLGWDFSRKPNTPHVDDEEFDGTIPSRARLGTGAVSTIINPYDAITTSNEYRHSWNVLRPSWALWQPASAGTAWATHWSLAAAVGTNRTCWARMMYNSRYSATVVNGDHGISFGLSGTASGEPDPNNQIVCALSETDTNEYALQTAVTVAGVSTGNVEVVPTLGQERLLFDTMLFHKVGSNLFFYVASNSGWHYLPTLKLTSVPAILDRAFFSVNNAATTEPGNMIMGADFMRHSDSIILP